MRSIFLDKSSMPTIKDLETALGSTYKLWKNCIDFTKHVYPEVVEEWNYSGDKFGWSFRLKDKKRVLVYLLPRDKFFKVAFVFGQKATDAIFESPISENIKSEIRSAKVYAEGRGIRVDVKNKSVIHDIEKLIEIKIR
ncbi:MAG: DUF3788 domain-containing protein [Bacteroidia bacterium]|nr:DUF3788 domain-containing protein [Bacteroidota bacterium]MBK7429984.1 DUF3788 domain-containing protein [Bacteroidota bacterium]MBP9790656.1 DUF3788 domain-containing protein [Bacteroidia bacterium]MBP9923564.1 DUF3788 domain-containing protein [Bacteroidia bacterium]